MEENRQKHSLVEELSNYVSVSVSEMLEQEREFFDSDIKDKLKVPPFTKVKRIPRDYTNEEEIVLKYKHQRDLEEKTKSKTTGLSGTSLPVSELLLVNDAINESSEPTTQVVS